MWNFESEIGFLLMFPLCLNTEPIEDDGWVCIPGKKVPQLLFKTIACCGGTKKRGIGTVLVKPWKNRNEHSPAPGKSREEYKYHKTPLHKFLDKNNAPLSSSS